MEWSTQGLKFGQVFANQIRCKLPCAEDKWHLDGLLRDKSRKPGKSPIPAQTVARVVALTCGKPMGEVTQWTGRAMAWEAGLALTSVQRIWRAHDPRPHRVGSFKRSRDPHADKLIEIVGLYLAPRRRPWCCPSTRRAKFRRPVAPSWGCRSSPAAVPP